MATLLALQRSEITEHHIYKKIAAAHQDAHNREVLERIANQELGHYAIWKQYTRQDVAPATLRIWFYFLIARGMGMTFAIKLMEGLEKRSQGYDQGLVDQVPEAREIQVNEENHERELIALIDEERLRYVGSIVLGLNDALVEFTGTLAGLTFAIQNTQIIAVAGLIMGVAGSLSMGASEYLSQRSDGEPTNPFRVRLPLLQTAWVLSARSIILACRRLRLNLCSGWTSPGPAIVLLSLPWEGPGLLHSTSSIILSLPISDGILTRHFPSGWWATLCRSMNQRKVQRER